jgi:hypothetical protein
MGIDAVEEGAGNALAITLRLDWPARDSRFKSPKYPHGQGFTAATSMNSEGNVALPAARDTVTFPSSSG